MNSTILTKLLRDNPIVVTGMGSFSSAGDSVNALWEAAVAGKGLAAWRDFEFESGTMRFAVCTAPELDPTQPLLHSVRKMDRVRSTIWVTSG